MNYLTTKKHKWINDGIECLKDESAKSALKNKLNADSSTENMIAFVGEVLHATKTEGTYFL